MSKRKVAETNHKCQYHSRAHDSSLSCFYSRCGLHQEKLKLKFYSTYWLLFIGPEQKGLCNWVERIPLKVCSEGRDGGDCRRASNKHIFIMTKKKRTWARLIQKLTIVYWCFHYDPCDVQIDRFNWRTRMHSSRMRTARLLHVSPSMHCSWGVCSRGGEVSAPRGVAAPGGWDEGLLPGWSASRGWYPSMHWGTCEQNHRHM